MLASTRRGDHDAANIIIRPGRPNPHGIIRIAGMRLPAR